jgi:hypothetical protein
LAGEGGGGVLLLPLLREGAILKKENDANSSKSIKKKNLKVYIII